MGLIAPTQHWAINGFGTPKAIYLLYRLRSAPHLNHRCLRCDERSEEPRNRWEVR